jgi:hypothetical protein
MPRRHEILTELGKITEQFKQWLDENPHIDVNDQIFIENHLHIAQFGYTTWKSRATFKERKV